MTQQWLLTVKSDVEWEKLESELKEIGGQRTGPEAVPLDENEMVVAVEGPDDLPEKLQGNENVLSIATNSELTFDV